MRALPPDRAPRGDARPHAGTEPGGLRDSEARLQLALEASNIGTHIYDVGADQHELDARAREISGLTADASISDWARRVHPDDKPRIAVAAERALDPDGDGLFDEEYRLTMQDGAPRWVYVRSRTVFTPDADGLRRPARVVGTIQDVTARKETEGALQRSEAQLRRIAETVPDVLFRTTADGHVDFVNAHFETLTGRPLSEAIGSLMWARLVHPDDAGRARDAWETARATEAPCEVHYRMLTTTGACWVILRAQPFYVPDGAVTAWFGTITDIDALTRAEDAVRDLNATLEARVARKTALARRLLARLAAAEQAERRRIAHVLHDDLQQRLAGLSISLALAERHVSPEGRSFARQATALLDGALDLTRTLASTLSPAVLGDDDIGALLRWVAERQHERFGLRVTVSVEDEPCLVPDASVREVLFQAASELLFNVVKHAGTDEARMSATRHGADIVVTVEDDGRGFSDAVCDPSEDDETERMGFGLPSLRERVHGAGGTFEIVTAPGLGTKVTISAPSGAPSL